MNLTLSAISSDPVVFSDAWRRTPDAQWIAKRAPWGPDAGSSHLSVGLIQKAKKNKGFYWMILKGISLL
jgi:hypothetical protein